MTARNTAAPLLAIRHLSVEFAHRRGTVYALDDVSLTLQKGEILVLLGESGCGKSVLCKAVMGLLPRRARITAGTIALNGQDLVGADEATLRTLRGRRLAMMFQNPLTILNPSLSVGAQLTEALRRYRPTAAKEDITAMACDILDTVGLSDARRRLTMMPHQLSGGQRQRCALAIALAMEPDILLADEPTTALDVTVQRQVLHTLKELRRTMGLSIVLITHDLGVAAYMADRIAVMYGGRIIETGTADDIFYHPCHPYTQGLLASVPTVALKGRPLKAIEGLPPLLTSPVRGDPFAPRNPHALAIDYVKRPPLFTVSPTHRAASWLLDPRAPTPPYPPVETTAGTDEDNTLPPTAPAKPPLLTVRHLRKVFPLPKEPPLVAVDDVSFTVQPAEIVGLVGESGCGKSTVARILMGRYPADGGTVTYGDDDSPHDDASLARVRRMQMIFQDADGALNPRMTAGDCIDEALRLTRPRLRRTERNKRIKELLSLVGLNEAYGGAYPGELSGGQRQRVAIARCLAVEPRLIIADEALAALDMSVQAQIINLLRRLQRREGFAILFIAHDIALVRYLCDRVLVMHRGRIVEEGKPEQLFTAPTTAYTKTLLDSVLYPAPKRYRGESATAFAAADATKKS